MSARAKLFALVIILAVFGALTLLLPVRDTLLHMMDWAQATGPLGMVAFAGVYVAACVAMLPASVLSLGAGFVYGPFYGALLVWPVSILGAYLAFVLSKSAARPWIEERLAAMPRVSAIYHGLGREGFRVVFLLRLTPVVPFSALNYALGLTNVRGRTFVLATALGILPGVILYTYLGSLVPTVAALASSQRVRTPVESVVFWFGLVATVLVFGVLTRIARNSLMSQASKG